MVAGCRDSGNEKLGAEFTGPPGVARERMLEKNSSRKEKSRGEITMESGADGLKRLGLMAG